MKVELKISALISRQLAASCKRRVERNASETLHRLASFSCLKKKKNEKKRKKKKGIKQNKRKKKERERRETIVARILSTILFHSALLVRFLFPSYRRIDKRGSSLAIGSLDHGVTSSLEC